jgi:hypothetical protein
MFYFLYYFLHFVYLVFLFCFFCPYVRDAYGLELNDRKNQAFSKQRFILTAAVNLHFVLYPCSSHVSGRVVRQEDSFSPWQRYLNAKLTSCLCKVKLSL